MVFNILAVLGLVGAGVMLFVALRGTLAESGPLLWSAGGLLGSSLVSRAIAVGLGLLTETLGAVVEARPVLVERKTEGQPPGSRRV
jgi:hypothetical protein